MNELTIESGSLRVTVQTSCADVWAVARPALEAALAAAEATSSHPNPLGGSREEEVAGPPRPSSSSHPNPWEEDGRKKSPGNAERVRELVAERLADGRSRERRELTKAVRDAGLSAAGFDQALRRDARFEKDTNVLGRPIYRDVTVASPYSAPTPAGSPPPTGNGNGIAVLGTLGGPS